MRLAIVLMAALCGAGLSTVTLAQSDPEEVLHEEVVSLIVGQEKLLRFSKDVTHITVITEDVVLAKPHSTRLVALTGVAPGATNMIILGAGGQQLYHAQVVVGPAAFADREPGHIVRIYGGAPPPRAGGAGGGGTTVNINNGGNQNTGAAATQREDYVARYCSPTGCGNPIEPPPPNQKKDAQVQPDSRPP